MYVYRQCNSQRYSHRRVLGWYWVNTVIDLNRSQIFHDYVQPPVQFEKVSKMSYLYAVVCAVLLNYSVKDLKNNTCKQWRKSSVQAWKFIRILNHEQQRIGTSFRNLQQDQSYFFSSLLATNLHESCLISITHKHGTIVLKLPTYHKYWTLRPQAISFTWHTQCCTIFCWNTAALPTQHRFASVALSCVQN